MFSAHEIILPHETDVFINSKDILKNVDLVIAEVSYPSTGMGIELGWAEAFGTRIIALHKRDTKLSSSIKAITKEIHSYDGDIAKIIEAIINE